MKSKDLLYLVLAAGILLVAGFLGYTQLMPKSASGTGVTVEKIDTIPSQLDSANLDILKDTTKVQNFNSPVDLNNLNNTQPFGR